MIPPQSTYSPTLQAKIEIFETFIDPENPNVSILPISPEIEEKNAFPASVLIYCELWYATRPKSLIGSRPTPLKENAILIITHRLTVPTESPQGSRAQLGQR